MKFNFVLIFFLNKYFGSSIVNFFYIWSSNKLKISGVNVSPIFHFFFFFPSRSFKVKDYLSSEVVSNPHGPNTETERLPPLRVSKADVSSVERWTNAESVESLYGGQFTLST